MMGRRDRSGGYPATGKASEMAPPPSGPGPGARRPVAAVRRDPARPLAEADPLESVARQLLALIGEDPDREGLADTPARWARWWREFVDHDPGNTGTTFDVVHADQMVAVTGVRVWSLCEHHLLPFYADLTMGYITETRVLGLSKFARIAQDHAHRLQVQERLVAGIADDLQTLTGSPSVAVVARGEHLCMTMRGVKSPATMHSSVTRGAFRDNAGTRAEFFALVG